MEIWSFVAKTISATVGAAVEGQPKEKEPMSTKKESAIATEYMNENGGLGFVFSGSKVARKNDSGGYPAIPKLLESRSELLNRGERILSVYNLGSERIVTKVKTNDVWIRDRGSKT